MKRCPECKFIYEDDQSLCDMDGVLLVYDSEKLPKPPKISIFHWRGRFIPAMATIVLSTVLLLVYYVSTHQTAKRPSYSPASITNSQPTTNELAPGLTTPVENKPDESTPTHSPKAPEPKPANNSGSKPVEPRKTKEGKTTTTRKTSTASQPQKSDSKVESIFKKTGRILKKPFKF